MNIDSLAETFRYTLKFTKMPMFRLYVDITTTFDENPGTLNEFISKL